MVTELQREVATPLDPGRAPLVRAVLPNVPHRATFILTAHHSIADGRSLTFAVRNSLLVLFGTPRDALMVTPSIESMLDSADSRPIEVASTGETDEIEEMKPSVHRLQHGLMPSVRGLSVSAVLTVKFRKRAQQE
jgi:hypothetical protein